MFEVKINSRIFKAGTFTEVKEKFITDGAKMSRSKAFEIQGFIYDCLFYVDAYYMRK